MGPHWPNNPNAYTALNQKLKIINIHKDFFGLYQLFMDNFLCQTVPKSFNLLTTWLTQFSVITNRHIYFRFNLYYSHEPDFMAKKTAINFILLFIHQKCFYFFLSFFLFSSSDMHQSHYLVGCHSTGINFFLIFFTCLALFISIKNSHKSNMNNCFRIIVIKIMIIEVSIIKINNNKIHIIAKNCDNVRICINKKYLIIKNYSILPSLPSILFVTNQWQKISTESFSKHKGVLLQHLVPKICFLNLILLLPKYWLL